MTMELTLQRTHAAGAATLGRLEDAAGDLLCYTLEDELREVEGQPVSEWKIKGATAIPSGRYRVTLEHSGRFGPSTLTLNDVPGFSYIRMHAGNTDADTEGCPLLGMKLSGDRIVGGTSGPAVALVKRRVMDAIDAGQEVWLTVSNPSSHA